jgi:hypothetical protein
MKHGSTATTHFTATHAHAHAHAHAIRLQVVAASGQYLAVGAASGSALVFQLPVPQAAAGGQGAGAGPQHPQSHSTGSGHSPLPGGAAMWQLGHVGGQQGALGFDPVTSLGFSTVGAARDALWLAVGHASGSLTVWELQKRGPRQVAVIGECTWAWRQGLGCRAAELLDLKCWPTTHV